MRRVLIASAIAHGLLFACILHVRPKPIEAPTAPPIEDVALDLEEATPRANTPAEESPAVAVATRSATRIVEPVATATATTPEVETLPESATRPYASNGTIVVFAPNIGLGGANPFLGRGALPDVVAPKGAASTDAFYVPENKRAEQAVKDALRARDQDIGLGLEGPVVHALEDATHAGFAPAHGMATFMAVIDERGLVIDLKLLGTPANAPGWDDVRARAVKSLATAKIDLRGVKRAELKIEVTSDVKMASGSDPNKKVVPTGDRKRTVIESAAPGSPSGADVVESREVAKFDVTDLGSKATRVVHAKLVMLVTR